MRRITKKTAGILTAGVVVLGGAGAAYAYWSGGGSGSGTASTSTGASPLTAVQTSTVSGLQPGGSAQTLSGNFTNPSGNGPVYVTSVTAAIDSVTKATGAPAGACTAADYTLANATMTVGAEVPVGTAQGSWSGATLVFNNTTSNQDGCKGATVTLTYTVS